MTLQPALLIRRLCAFLVFTALDAATAGVHEARQESSPSPTEPLATLSPGLIPLSSFSPTSTTSETTTMPPTSSSKQSSSSSSRVSYSPTSSNPPLQSSVSSSHSSSSSSSPSAAPSASATSPSQTSTDTPKSSPSPGFLNLSVYNTTTCTPGLISWKYNGNEAELLLSVTNIGVNQSDASPSRLRTRQNSIDGTIQQQLVDTNTSALSWTWSPVNLTQGWYEIQGLVLSSPRVSNTSAPFFVTNGTDVSCLTATSPTTSPSTTPSSSPTATTTDVAAIAGGVVGGVVGVALAIIAGVCLWSQRRKRPFIRGGRKYDKNWGSLKSTDSSVQPEESGAQLAGDRFHGRSESTTGVLEDVARGKASAMTTPGGSDEGTGEEKLVSPASSAGMSPFDVLNTPVHYDRRSSVYYSISMPTPIATESPRSRSTSQHTSNQSIELQTQRIRSSMETSIQRRSERLSMPTLPSPGLTRFPHSTHSQAQEEHPLSSVTATPVNRSISTGAVSVAARRASRKPVPQYDPSVLLEDANADSVSTFTAGAESSQSHGTGMGAGTSGTPTDLRSQSSFGDGRPVHYLIPDMPLPQTD